MWRLAAVHGHAQVRTAGMAGVVIGFDLPALVAIGAAMGVPAAAVAVFGPAVEAGMVAGLARMRDEAPGE